MSNLERYRAIGWDFDGTLIDSDQSEGFADFVRRNPFNQEFHIVTFRSHGMQDDIDEDMAYLNLDRSYFKSVVNIADEMYEAYHRAMTGQSTRAEDITAYCEWKAKVCRELDIGILIDDMTDQVVPGCQRYDIDYLHPAAVILPVFAAE